MTPGECSASRPLRPALAAAACARSLPLVRGRRVAVALRAGGWLQQLGVDAPLDVGALDSQLGVAVALGERQRVDRVVGPLRRLDVLGGEVLPDEAADRADAERPQRLDRIPLVVLVEEDQLEPVRAGPLLVLGDRDLVGRGLGHPGLVPDRVALALGRRFRARSRPGPGEHEGLVAEPIEGRADLAGDDGLTARRPLADDPDPHRFKASQRLRASVIPSATASIATSTRSSPAIRSFRRDDHLCALVLRCRIEDVAAAEHVVEDDQAARAAAARDRPRSSRGSRPCRRR